MTYFYHLYCFYQGDFRQSESILFQVAYICYTQKEQIIITVIIYLKISLIAFKIRKFWEFEQEAFKNYKEPKFNEQNGSSRKKKYFYLKNF